MNHIQISIEATEAEQEILISQLTILEATGFEQTDTHLIAYFEEDHFASYEVYGVLKKFAYTINTVNEQNWNALWEADFKPVVVAHFCAVRAHFHQPVAGVTHQIIITPKMSFGTGHHTTTFMMLQAMQSLRFANKTVLDFGTGTGILAILAEKLGASHITAIDNDIWSFENVQENIQLNTCHAITALHAATIPATEIYDIVLANITKNVLLDYMGILKSCLAAGGFLLCSGFIQQDKGIMQEAAQNRGMKVVLEIERDGWIAMLFVNSIRSKC